MTELRPLGRLAPPDDDHVRAFPLTTPILSEITEPRPVVIGVNWYSNFDSPVDDNGTPWRPGRTPVGHWWIGRGSLGSVRGGHCVTLKPKNTASGPYRKPGSWDFYDQGSEGACVGFGWSQAMSAMNQKFYFARWLWDRSKEIDYWPETNPGDDEGTSVKHAADILRNRGHVRWSYTYDHMNTDGEGSDWIPRAKLSPVYSEGITANRWISSMDDLLNVLGYSGRDYVDMWNSWGRSYPNLVRIPVSTMERLWREDGEICVPTDR